MDPWTVFRVSSVFSLVLSLGVVLGLVIFWSVIQAAEIPDQVTDILIRITLLEEGSDPFGTDEYFLRLAVFGSMVGAVLLTGFLTLGAVMYNLIADVVGGVEVVVLEEVMVAPAAATSTATLTPPAPQPEITEAPTAEHRIEAEPGSAEESNQI